MNTVNRIYVVSMIVLAVGLPALAEEKLAFHVSCGPAESDCVEMKLESDPGNPIFAKREPEMTLSQSDVEEAHMAAGQFGQEVLQLTMKSGAAEKFAKVTGDHVGKQLVVVAGGKALIAPTIQTSITGGNVMLSTGANNKSDYLESLPWLKKMTEDKKASEARLSTLSIGSYLALGILLIGGSVYYAFFRGRGMQRPANEV